MGARDGDGTSASITEAALVESRTTPAETVKRELGGKVEHLEAKLVKKDAVIAELSEALVDLKKELGEL